MGFQENLGGFLNKLKNKLNVKNAASEIAEKTRGILTASEDEVNDYLEMIYGLFYSRGLDDRDARAWSIDKERARNYVEFHLDKPCNQKALSLALDTFDYNGYYYYFPKEESKIEKLNAVKDSEKYRYSQDEAYSIANTKLKDLQEAAALFDNETIKKYYVVANGLLSSVTDGISSEGIKNYIEFKLSESCNSELLCKVLGLLAKVKPDPYHSATKIEVYRLVGPITDSNYHTYLNSAKLHYLSDKVFDSTSIYLADAKAYQCSQEEAYQVCYSGVVDSLKEDYQKILQVVETHGTEDFETGLKKIIDKYRDIMGEEPAKECIHNITKAWYFENNKTICKILVERMAWYLYRNMMKPDGSFNESLLGCYKVIEKQAAAIALRALNFEKAGGNQEGYTSITKDACIEFVSNNEYFKSVFEKEVAKNPFDTSMEELTESMANSISCYNLFSSGRHSVWYLPSIDSEPYYADSVCADYWLVTVITRQLEKSTNSNDVFDKLYEKLMPNEGDKRFLEKEKEKEQVRRQCMSCAFNDRCQLPQRALNCSAYFPK